MKHLLTLSVLLAPALILEANQKSHHGHISYNLQRLSHLHQRPPTNVTASAGVGVDFTCKVISHQANGPHHHSGLAVVGEGTRVWQLLLHRVVQGDGGAGAGLRVQTPLRGEQG